MTAGLVYQELQLELASLRVLSEYQLVGIWKGFTVSRGDLETLSLQLLAGIVLKTVGGVLKFGAIQRKFKFLVVQGSVWEQVFHGPWLHFCVPELWWVHYHFNVSSGWRCTPKDPSFSLLTDSLQPALPTTHKPWLNFFLYTSFVFSWTL